MSVERNIIKILRESNQIMVDNEELDERTYTVGDIQYWRRNGKCYSWTASGGRKECSEDEYMKAISDGNPQATSSKEDKTTSSASIDNGSVTIDMNGYKYKATVDGLTDKEVVDKYNSIAKHSPGRAIQWIKNNGKLSKDTTNGTPVTKSEPAKEKSQPAKNNSEYESALKASKDALKAWKSTGSDVRSRDPEALKAWNKSVKELRKVSKASLDKTDWNNVNFKAIDKEEHYEGLGEDDNDDNESFSNKPLAVIKGKGAFMQSVDFLVNQEGEVCKRVTNYGGVGGTHYLPVSDKVLSTIKGKVLSGDYKAE